MKKLIYVTLLLLTSLCYSQTRKVIIIDNVKYTVKERVLLYKDTIYICDKNTSLRFTKDIIYVYRPHYYKKIKRNK
jgi:hypothetical protein